MDSRRNEEASTRPGGDDWLTGWEARVAGLAREFAYPPAPDLAARSPDPRAVARRRPFVARPAFALALILLAAGVILLATPEARSAVLRVLQVGVARIFFTDPGSGVVATSVVATPVVATPAPATPAPEATQPPGAAMPEAGAQLPVAATPPVATATAVERSGRGGPLPSGLKDLTGRTTLAEAQQAAPFPIALPAYPPGLGEPDYVFIQEHGAPVVALAWGDPGKPGGVGLSLWMFPKGTLIDKIHPDTVVETTVDGGRAVWTQGRHMMYATDGDAEWVRLVLGNTLIWERGDMTLRLETFLPLDEAVKVAESVE